MSAATMERIRWLLPAPGAPQTERCLRRASGTMRTGVPSRYGSRLWPMRAGVRSMGGTHAFYGRSRGASRWGQPRLPSKRGLRLVFANGKAEGTTFLFRVGDYVHDVIGIVLYDEIETPVFVNAGLPEIIGFVVFFRAEGRMPEILLEKFDLLEERLSHVGRESLKDFVSLIGVMSLHRARFARLVDAFFLSSAFMASIVS